MGALGYVRAVGELVAQGVRPDVIIHPASSGGTQAGIVAGCALHGLGARVIGISADDPAASVGAQVSSLVTGVGELLGADLSAAAAEGVEVDDGFVGEGYGVPSDASREAQSLAARSEALFVDHTYTAKALAALIAYARAHRFGPSETVVFWHTGGQVGLFA
jgi:1-aminocyclopropane-1-carboxylate deaminase/D-cysteine desulfhydrase-like pyridoxal-dependent ACC family enzyme